MSRACLDNHILIWGIRGVAAVVVAEFLAGVPRAQHTELLKVLSRRFQLPPFDVRAAAVAAGLWRDAAERSPHLRDQIREAFPGTSRTKIKADIQILATALARNTDILYTHDSALRMMAEGRIEVRGLPPAPPTQVELLL